MDNLKKISEFIIGEAAKNGADESDVLIVNSTKASVKVRLGNIEELKQANPKSLGIRIFKNKKKALTYTSDFREESLKKLVKQTVEMVQVTGEDKLCGLPDSQYLGKANVTLNLFDPKIETIPMSEKIRLATEIEKIGMKQSPLITNSDGASWSDSRSKIVLANSLGFYGEQEYSNCALVLSLVAEKDGVKQTDYWYTNHRFFNKLDPIESVAKIAAERTLRKLGARKPKSQTVPVIFDPNAGQDFLSILESTVIGTAIYRRNSFLIDKLNQEIAVKDFTLIDDGLMPDGLGSRFFDDEGLPSRKNVVIENGVLKKYLCDCYSAKKLGVEPTGSASRGVGSAPAPGASNFYLQKGSIPPEEMIASVKGGLYLTNVHWVGINYVTGDYSRGAEGIWIENGKLTYPVQEFTIAGNMLGMMKNITMIGNDLKFRDSVNSPTFKIKELVISGS
ncbi:MAG: peptidase [Candidatus Marinimicrobia bacterium CG08_land_8_20_14_0_20_45_22]|nr:MAG: peptidase [Candidatus Marinimicrobia bacterium CG08_land_8_20_14_0_20_45_22]